MVYSPVAMAATVGRPGVLAWSPTICHRNAENPNDQDPHCLVHCAAPPETMWVQHHNGIFVSRNAGIHWDRCTDVDPSTFGFAVAVHPHDGDTAWFVPAVKDETSNPSGWSCCGDAHTRWRTLFRQAAAGRCLRYRLSARPRRRRDGGSTRLWQYHRQSVGER